MSKTLLIRMLALILIVSGLSAAFISGNTASAQCTPAPTSGDDYIVCEGGHAGDVSGEGGNDIIIIVDSANVVEGGAGNDTITNNGIATVIIGTLDAARLFDPRDVHASGNDVLTNNNRVLSLIGTVAGSDTGKATAAGSTLIVNYGRVDNWIIGDQAISDFGLATTIGNAVIVNYGQVGDIAGDWATSRTNNTATANGDDLIINYGTVRNMIGDFVEGDGATIADGDDTIINHGTTYYIYGDRTQNNGGTAIASGDDTIINYGEVAFDIIGDQASDWSAAVSITSGNDTIINHGTVHGDIIGAGGDDQVTIVNFAPVHGIMDGGAGNDTLTFSLASADYRVLEELEALANGIIAGNGPQSGSAIINGVTFTWTNFEELTRSLELLAAYVTWPVQVFYPDGETIAIWAPASASEGFKVAEFHRSELIPGTSGQRFDLPEGRGWCVIVYWVVDHFQVNVYDQNGVLVTDRYLIY